MAWRFGPSRISKPIGEGEPRISRTARSGRLEGQAFGDVPLTIELKLEVGDSPNSAGIVIDALRCAKLALDRGISGPLIAPARTS